MGLVFLFSIILIIIGIYEKYFHQKNLDTIPIRVNVNGIRGKSTVTRLMTGILTAAGYRVVGKTTGTEARMLYWYTKVETEIVRRLEGANIGEQKRVVAAAVKAKANALVSECMAVTPDYQIIFQNNFLQANIGVIVNVLEDHLDVMGPTLDDIAEAFLPTIPYGGKLIIAPGPYENYFKATAEKRKTEVLVADTAKIGKEELRQFSSIYFPENIAIALALAKALDIDEEIAWQGMLMANPDPGVANVHTLNILDEETYFVNGFAANDVMSTFAIWEMVKNSGYPTENIAVVLNCRADRIDRSFQFAKEFLTNFPSDLIICMGQETKPVSDVYNSGKIETNEFCDVHDQNGYEIYKSIEEKLAGKTIFGIGNIHGTAFEFIDAILKLETKDSNPENKTKGENLCKEQNYILHL